MLCIVHLVRFERLDIERVEIFCHFEPSPHTREPEPSADYKAPVQMPAIHADSRTTGSDTSDMMRTAEDYVAQRDFANAEKVYRDLLAIDPSNADAIKGLATVLYREDKIEESAEVFDRLPK